MKPMLILVLTFLLGACALPQTNVQTGSPRPQLAIRGAPVDAVLVVDGISMGPASQFNGNPKVLIVEEGAHRVEIQRAGHVIHVERTFVGNGETRVVTVNAGGQ
jgi:hypothetical protein